MKQAKRTTRSLDKNASETDLDRLEQQGMLQLHIEKCRPLDFITAPRLVPKCRLQNT